MNTGLRLKSTRPAGPGGTGLQFWLLGRLRQKDHTFKACVGHRVSSKPARQLSETPMSKQKMERG